MDVNQALNDLPGVGADDILAERPKAGDQVRDGSSRHELEEDVQTLVRVVVVSKVLDDIGVAQALVEGELLQNEVKGPVEVQIQRLVLKFNSRFTDKSQSDRNIIHLNIN